MELRQATKSNVREHITRYHILKTFDGTTGYDHFGHSRFNLHTRNMYHNRNPLSEKRANSFHGCLLFPYVLTSKNKQYINKSSQHRQLNIFPSPKPT